MPTPVVERRTPVSNRWPWLLLALGLAALASPNVPLAQEEAEKEAQIEPRRVQRVKPAALLTSLELDGVAVSGGVKLAAPIVAEVEQIEYQEGDDPTVHVRPGRGRVDDLVLTGSLPIPTAQLAWFEAVRSGNVERKSGSVVLEDASGNEVSRINFFEAYPTKLAVDIPKSTWTLTLVAEIIDFGG